MPNIIFLSPAGLLEMSLCGAILIAITVLLRIIAKNRLPKMAFIALWGIVLIRLLVPYHLCTPLSIYPNVSLSNQSESTEISTSFYPTAAEKTLETSSNLIQEYPQKEESALAGNELYNQVAWDAVKGLILVVLWGIGIAGVGGYFLISMVRCRYMLATALPLEGHPEAECWLEGHTLRRKVRLYVSDQISTPLTYGTFRPKILLPKNMDFSDTRQLEFILAHELHHIQQFDTLWKLASTVALCIHWFNPLVWVMNRLLNQDLEFACDEAVLRRYGKASRQGYAMSLIQMAERNSFPSPLCSSFSKNTLEERIRSIMKFHPASVLAGAMAVILVGGIGTLFGTFPIDNRNSMYTITSVAEDAPVEVASFTVSPTDVTVKATEQIVLPGTKLIDAVTIRNTDRIGEDISTSFEFSPDYTENAVESAATTLEGIAQDDTAEYAANEVDRVTITSSNPVTEEANSHNVFAFVENFFESIYQRSDLANSFKRYEKFGLKYNPVTEAITYQGKKVKYFADKKPGKDTYQLYCENGDGIINVTAVYNEKNRLVGLQEISDMQAQMEKDIHNVKKAITSQFITQYSYDDIMNLYDAMYLNWENLMIYSSEFDDGFIETTMQDLESLLTELEMILANL